MANGNGNGSALAPSGGISPQLQAILQHPAVQAHLRSQTSPTDAVDFAAVDVPAVIHDGEGNPIVNYAKYGVKTQWLTGQPSTPTTTASPPNSNGDASALLLPGSKGAQGQISAFVERPGVAGGDTEFLGIMSKSTGRYSCQLFSQTLNLLLSNAPMLNTLMFGQGSAGSPWPCSFYEPGTGNLQAQNVSNLTLDPNSIALEFVGRRFVTNEANETIEARRARFLTSKINPFYVAYDPDPATGDTIEYTLAPLQTLTLTATLPSIGDFLATTWLDDSSYEDGSAGPPQFKVQLQDGLTGYNLMDVPVWIEFVAALNLGNLNSFATPAQFQSAAFPGAMSELLTHLFSRSGKIQATFVSYETEKTITLRPGARGVLLRYPAAKGMQTNQSIAQRQALLGASGVPQVFNNIVAGGPGTSGRS
jgi:hypothetical protein